MKVSELIKLLEEAQFECGDVTVTVEGCGDTPKHVTLLNGDGEECRGTRAVKAVEVYIEA